MVEQEPRASSLQGKKRKETPKEVVGKSTAECHKSSGEVSQVTGERRKGEGKQKTNTQKTELKSGVASMQSKTRIEAVWSAEEEENRGRARECEEF